MDNSQNVVIHTSIQVHQLQIMMTKVRCKFLGTLGLVKPQSCQDVIYCPTCYLLDMQWNMQHTPCNLLQRPTIVRQSAYGNLQNMTGMKQCNMGTYDGVNSWGSSGAKGAERGSLLSTANLARKQWR